MAVSCCKERHLLVVHKVGKGTGPLAELLRVGAGDVKGFSLIRNMGDRSMLALINGGIARFKIKGKQKGEIN